MTTILAPFFQYLLSFLFLYKYFGLFVVALLSSIALPIPASTVLAAAGGFASQGYFNIYLVLGITLLGSMTGNIIGYILAKKYGEKILSRFVFFRHILQSKSFHEIEDYIVDFAPSLIFFSRFLTELSPATNLMAGISKVSWKTFFTFALFGEIAYTIMYGMTGFYLGSEWQNNLSFFLKAGVIVFALGVGVNLIQILLYKKRTRKN
jgi:membrane protein DedA with SNARE-associated domain